jgi:predicted nuclease of predicted toxin-antitoxin system
MIRFLMDENIPPPVVDFLRKRGFDAKEIGKTGTRGASDDEIMQQALQEGRVLVTLSPFGTSGQIWQKFPWKDN